MQQRRLRLGDILDDYCPRERRITNHAVVAMIDDEVRQTRCTTCDADHEYKQARVPPQRRKRPGGAADTAEAAALRLRSVAEEASSHDPSGEIESAAEPIALEEPTADAFESAALESASSAPDAEVSEPAAEQAPPLAADDDGPVHRRLIRATLPRPEGQMPERKIPDFTIRHHGARGREFNGKGQGGRRRPARGEGSSQPSRFGGPRHGSAGPRSGAGQGPRPAGNRNARPEGQRANRSGSRGRGPKRGR